MLARKLYTLLMSREDIIHGDLKPQNVLIFKDVDTFIAKLTDFGYSRYYSSPSENYCLPLCKPWNAPGVNGSNKEFSLEDAKIADIYSYALLCAWILYGDQFLDHTDGYNDRISLISLDGSELKSILMLETLKTSKQLEKVVLKCASHDTDLETAESKALADFFCTILGENHNSCCEIWKCLKLLEQ